jgi:hypothetical protein
MPSRSYENGLGSICSRFAVLQSNYDGADCVEELAAEFDRMADDPECQGRPVPVYSMRGTVGNVEVDLVYFYMLGGVPLILDPGIVVKDFGNGRIEEIQTSGRFVTEMFSHNNDAVFSIGYVDDPCEAYAYAVEYTSRNVPSPDTGIDAGLVNSYLATHPDTMLHVGTIQKMGGTVFDVYAVGATESAMFRPDKDFMGGEPDVEDDKENRGKVEVLLCGGNPDIVCIGSVCGADGWMFRVWVPNERGYVDCGMHIIEQDDIPREALYVDSDELAQAFILYDEKLKYDELAEEGETGEEEEESDVPDFDYEDYYEEEDRERRERAAKP